MFSRFKSKKPPTHAQLFETVLAERKLCNQALDESCLSINLVKAGHPQLLGFMEDVISKNNKLKADLEENVNQNSYYDLLETFFSKSLEEVEQELSEYHIIEKNYQISVYENSYDNGYEHAGEIIEDNEKRALNKVWKGLTPVNEKFIDSGTSVLNDMSSRLDLSNKNSISVAGKDYDIKEDCILINQEVHTKRDYGTHIDTYSYTFEYTLKIKPELVEKQIKALRGANLLLEGENGLSILNDLLDHLSSLKSNFEEVSEECRAMINKAEENALELSRLSEMDDASEAAQEILEGLFKSRA